MGDSELKQWQVSRKYMRGQVTKHYNNVQSNVQSFTRSQILNLVAKFKPLGEDLKVLNAKIATAIWAANDDETKNNFEVEFNSCMEYDEKIIDAVSLLEEHLKGSQVGLARDQNDKSQLKRPTAPLPTFNSLENESLEKFFFNFEAVVEKFSYSDYEKLLLLKQQIKGRASTLLDSLESEKQTYTDAKELLTLALASPLNQKYNVLKQLSEIKLTYDMDPFEFISQMKSITESFKVLKIDCDMVLQYFFWHGLNETFKTQLMHITNKNKPSLEEILNNFFDASERYMTVKKKFKESKTSNDKSQFSKSKSFSRPTSSLTASSKFDDEIAKPVTSLAANVKFDKEAKPFSKSCIICSLEGIEPSSHPIYKCPNFVTAKLKLEKLKSFNVCQKCAVSGHNTQNCEFHFNRKCINCTEWHFSFLCPRENIISSETTVKSEKQNQVPIKKVPYQMRSKVDKQKTETVSGTVWTEALASSGCNESILPTFSCNIGSDTVRGMKDSGCQMNFISVEKAENNNLNILKSNFELTVNGFNSSQRYLTNSVELPLRFGDTVYNIEAICVPSIKTCLKLPGLSNVVKLFHELGYKLADSFLKFDSDEISGIDLVLGNESSHCIPESAVSFGQPVPSIFYRTPIGVMLAGNVNRILNNARFLSTSGQPVFSNGDGFTDRPPKFIDNDLNNREFNETHFLVSDANFEIFNSNGKVNNAELQKATEDVLNENCFKLLNYDKIKYDEESNETYDRIVNYVLTNTTREQDGRLIMPLTWNGKVSHLLGNNYHLAKQILNSNLNRYSKDQIRLKMIDETFKEQERMGVVERVEDLPQFLEENPQSSFLAHMPVFKMDRTTSKCRNVFLSNLCGKDKAKPMTISHNQAMLSGPCLNKKLSTSLLLLRFDEKVMCFDLKRAFLQIALNELDQSKLLFLWYKNVEKGDFTIVGYRNLRLSFGLRCSPTILMLALYKILMLDTEDDSESIRDLKAKVYDLIYMDNGAYSTNDNSELRWAYQSLGKIFQPYKFELQQFVTNDVALQQEIDLESGEVTPDKVKLFGLQWDRVEDELSVNSLHLNASAGTKRQVLQTISTNFDLFNYAGPILNRARIFLHGLQCNKDIGWDMKLSPDLTREWKNIAKQVNSTPSIPIKRFIGRRDSKYKLIAFTDSSKLIYGTVIFIQDLDTKEVNFVLAKNRLVNRQLETKTIPSLEFQAISLGVENLIDLKNELTGVSCVKPINIVELQLYSDSMVSLTWINSYVNKLDKMQKRSVFVMNRLNRILKLCETFPIKFSFVSGCENPADLISRPVSYKQLIRSCYFSGPDFLTQPRLAHQNPDDFLDVVVPNPLARRTDAVPETQLNLAIGTPVQTEISLNTEHLVSMKRFSSFQKIVAVHEHVLNFVNKLKLKLKLKDPAKYDKMTYVGSGTDLYLKACNQVILNDQKINFPEIFRYFKSNKKLKDMPQIVGQLNVYPDDNGILRVGSKCNRGKPEDSSYFPILLSKNSTLTYLIILDLHKKLAHAGCYSLLSELRKRFYIPHYYSIVKQVLKECVSCKRFNERGVKLNQSPYREFRLNPPNIPFRYIFVDHLGPYWVKSEGKKVKTWILCITCLWSRAINLKICIDLTTNTFLRALQLHSFEYGIPELCLSDLGTQLTAGANVITDFINEPETQQYFQENGVKGLKFEQYFKGCNQLGSLVEICVKMTKRLIYGAIKNTILEYFDFEFVVCQTVHLVNRRPIAFKEGLRSGDFAEFPDPITPELLTRGYDLLSINIIPALQSDPDPDPTWSLNEDPVTLINNSYEKLKKVRQRLIDIYHSEFLATLIAQATNLKDRYKPVLHHKLKKGDIVLLKEPLLKPSCFPMGLVRSVEVNVGGEVTGITVFKGKTRELVKRHVSSIIPLLSVDQSLGLNEAIVTDDSTDKIAEIEIPDVNSVDSVKSTRPLRRAAERGARNMKSLIDQNLV